MGEHAAAEEREAAVDDVETRREDRITRREDHRVEAEDDLGDELGLSVAEEGDALEPLLVAVPEHLALEPRAHLQ